MNNKARRKTPLPRVPTGIGGLDEVLNGGIIGRRSHLVMGCAGTGKTVFSLQWLIEGASRGERCMYISLAEPITGISRNSESFGWSLDGIDLIDLSASGEAEAPGEYQVFTPGEVENVAVWNAILSAVADKKPQRVVLDSLTHLRFLSTDSYQFRKHMRHLLACFDKAESTSYLLYEPGDIDRDPSAALAVDGVIHLRHGYSPGLGTGLRSIRIEKLRGSDFISGWHPMRIGAQGMTVFPHRIEGPAETPPAPRQVSSAIDGLDPLLGGGLDLGATTMLSGPTGVGKTSLATHLMIQAMRAGGRAAIYTFEEAAGSIHMRLDGLGEPIKEYLSNGSLRIVRINPMQVYPDELLAMIRDAVLVEGVAAVTIDSLRGYQFAMEEFGMAQAHIHNLLTFLNRNGVTTVVINEMDLVGSSDLKVSDMGVSHLADNVVLMRYAESDGETVKVINTVKRRSGSFAPGLRELRFSGSGISVHRLAQRPRRLLSGSPTLVAEAL